MANTFLKDIREIVITEGLKNKCLSEASLCKKLGVGRTSIRESLKHLEEENLIERRQKAGITLKTPSLQELIEIYDIRILLEGLAARYLTENLTSAVLHNLKKTIEDFNRIQKGKNNKLKLIMADAKFHQIIIESCRNKYLARIIDNLQLITLSFRVAKDTPVDTSFFYPHEKVIAALEAGNPQKAEKMLRLHIEEGKNRVIKFLLGPAVKLYQQKKERWKGCGA